MWQINLNFLRYETIYCLRSGYCYIVIENKRWVSFLTLKAALQQSDVTFSFCQIVLLVLKLAFTHSVIISTLLDCLFFVCWIPVICALKHSHSLPGVQTIITVKEWNCINIFRKQQQSFLHCSHIREGISSKKIVMSNPVSHFLALLTCFWGDSKTSRYVVYIKI